MTASRLRLQALHFAVKSLNFTMTLKAKDKSPNLEKRAMPYRAGPLRPSRIILPSRST